MPAYAAERIRTLIDTARRAAAASGRSLDIGEIYARALTRCGISRAEALALLADGNHDPVARILHFAGEEHNFAVLAVEEALATA